MNLISANIDYMELLYEDPAISIVDMLVMHTNENRNSCDIPKEAIIKALPTLANKPIWGIPNNSIFKSGKDFVEHARDEKERQDIRIFGIVPESSIKDAAFVLKKGKEYLKVRAILFKKYSSIPMNILANRDGECKISVEIMAKGETIDGILHVSELIFEAVVVLGADVREGIEGSDMKIVRFSLQDAIEESEQAMQKFYFAEQKKYKIPKNVKEAAQKGLDLRKEYGRGGTDVGLNMARYIVSNEYATYEKVKKISEYFPRHAGDNLDEKDPPSNGWVAWCLSEDALISLPNNKTKTIKEICEEKYDGEVLTYNTDTNKIEPRKVINWFINNSSQDEFYLLGKGKGNRRGVIKNKTMVFATGEHPFYSDGEWIDAKDMNGKNMHYLDYAHDKIVTQVIYGTYLGDSTITQDSALRFSHCDKQKEYLLEKQRLLSVIHSSTSDSVRKSEIGKGLKFSTCYSGVNSLYEDIRKETYDTENTKQTPMTFLNKLNEIAWAFWVMDDGAIHFDNRSDKEDAFHYRLHIEGFSEGSYENISKYFKEKGYENYLINRNNCNKKCLYFTREASRKLAKAISPYVIPSMRYKLPAYLRDEAYVLKGYQPTLDYRLGTIKNTKHSKLTDIEDRHIRKPRSKKKKYNITVDGNNNYFANGFLTHNCLWGGHEAWKWAKGIMKQEEKEESKNSLTFISEDEVGTGTALELDTSKDSLSHDDWGSVAKPEFKRACLKASNYKTICKTAFLELEEGWDKGKEGALKYPVMQKKSNKLVYNRYAIASAKAYAKTNNEAGVLAKVNKLYQKLDIGEEGEEITNKKIEFSLNNRQIFEIFDMATSAITYGEDKRKYWVDNYDCDYVYLRDCEEGKIYKMPYIISDENIATINFEKKTCVISNGYMEVGEDMIDEKMMEKLLSMMKAMGMEYAVEDKMDEKMMAGMMEKMMGMMQEKMADMEKKMGGMMEKYAEMEKEKMAMEEKYADMEGKYAEKEKMAMEYSEKLNTYEKKEEQGQMKERLEKFSHCLKEDEVKELEGKIESLTFAEFKTELDEKVMNHVLEAKDVTEEKRFSYETSHSEFITTRTKTDVKEKDSLEKIIEDSGVKFK